MQTLTHRFFSKSTTANTINALMAYDFSVVERALDEATVVILPWAVRETFRHQGPAYELAYALRNRIGGCVVEANIDRGVTAVGLRLDGMILDADGLHQEDQWEARYTIPAADFQAMAFPAAESKRPPLCWDAFYGDESALMSLGDVVTEIVNVLNL